MLQHVTLFLFLMCGFAGAYTFIGFFTVNHDRFNIAMRKWFLQFILASAIVSELIAFYLAPI